jgi:hypothetical protein
MPSARAREGGAVLVYHRTDDGAQILRDGFRDRIYPDWIAVASTERWAPVVLELDIPTTLWVLHELIPPPLRGYRGVLVSTVGAPDGWAIVPAIDLNEYRNTIRVLSDAQLDELDTKRQRIFESVWGLAPPPPLDEEP